MIQTIRFLFLFGILGFPAVFAAEFSTHDAKTVEDPLFIEITDEIYSYNPVNVTVHINDQVTKDEANFIAINPYNSLIYQTTGNPVQNASAGEFRGAMKYNGEDSISFGFRPQGGKKSGIDIKFVHAEVAKEGESTNTHDENSKYFGYISCNYEDNSLLCGDDDGCQVCYKYISIANRDTMINGGTTTVTLPEGMDKEQEHISAGSAFCGYIKEIEPDSDSTWSYREHVKYQMEVWDGAGALIDSIDAYKGKTYDDWEEEKIVSPVGGQSAFLFFKDQEIHNRAGQITLQYELYSDMMPLGSGMLNAKGSIGSFMTEDEKAAARSKLKSELLSMVGSFKLSEGEVFTPDSPLKHTYSLYDREVVEPEESEDLVAFGVLTDAFSNPLPFMKFRIYIDGIINAGITDEIGGFSVPLVGIKVGEDDIDASIIFDFEYERKGVQYFNMLVTRDGDDYHRIFVQKNFKISKGVNPEIRFKVDLSPTDRTWRTSLASGTDAKNIASMYYHMHEVTDFYLRKLKLKLDYKLPVSIWVGNRKNKTLYNPTNSDILIAASNASHSSTNRPKNREFHEFAHHVMYDLYGKWPSERLLPKTKNHGGFQNPSTADSFIEGFAEFMALVVSDELGQDNPDIYAGFGSLEKNYRPWDRNGKYEELAVASLLWDLYDNNNEDGDALYYSLDTIWDVIKVERKNFYEYYKAFKEKKPKDADKIDALFIKHGFFQDTREGNKKFDKGEPKRITNKETGAYKFIDLSDKASKIKYKKGFIIGPATNYERLTRGSAVMINNAFLKIADNNVDFYTIQVTDSDDGLDDYEYTVTKADGKIYMHLLPDNVEATLTVIPQSKDYTTEQPYTITNQALVTKLENSNLEDGFLDEHDFELEETGSKEDEHYEMFADEPPSQDYKGDLGEEIELNLLENDFEFETKKDFDSFDDSDETSFPWFKSLFVIFLGVYGYFYYKSESVRKNTRVVVREIKKYLIISWKWFLKYGVPFLKKTGLLILKYGIHFLKKTGLLIHKYIKIGIKWIKEKKK